MSDETVKPRWAGYSWHREHPIFYKPEELVGKEDLAELIQKLRAELTLVRGKLNDLGYAYGWKDRLETPEHGLTLIISNLHDTVEEIKKAR